MSRVAAQTGTVHIHDGSPKLRITETKVSHKDGSVAHWCYEFELVGLGIEYTIFSDDKIEPECFEVIFDERVASYD